MGSVAVKAADGIKWGGPSALTYMYAAICLFAAFFIYIAFRASHVIRTSGTGVNSQTYFDTHLVIIIIEAVLWAIIGRTAIRLKVYTRGVIDSPDGRALDHIANALLLSLPYAVLFSMATTVKTLFVHTPILKAATSVTNLLPLLLALLFSVFLLIGTLKLNRLLADGHDHPGPGWANALAILIYLVAMLVYGRYFYHTAPRIIDDDGLKHFGLTPAILLPTYLIPYAAVWLMGLLACLNLSHFAIHVQGRIYRLLFRDLYKGLMLGFAGIYLVQLFTISDLSSNNFGAGFMVFIMLLALLIAGCLLILRGVNHLAMLDNS